MSWQPGRGRRDGDYSQGRGGGGYGQNRGGGGFSQNRGGGGFGQNRGGGGFSQGRGAGGFGEGRGGGGHRGDGGYGQGRGGAPPHGGGGRPPRIVEVFSPPSTSASQPNAEVTKVENEFMKYSAATLGLDNMNINQKAQDFPRRPGHGTRGNEITVFANYFELKTPSKPLVVFRYGVDVIPAKLVRSDGRLTVSKVKTRQLISLLLQSPGFEGTVSDSRSNLISCNKIALPEFFDIPYKTPGEDDPPANPEMYRIRVQSTGSFNISDFLDYLRSAEAATPAYSVRQEIIQALNIVLGHYAQSSSDVSTIGQGKHFSLDRNPANRRSFGGGIEALRGFFRSVRPATSRLLLNVNISHAVCYEPLRLDQLMREFGLENKITLARHLKYLRVLKLHLPTKMNRAGNIVSSVASIYDLATINDGATGSTAPQVRSNGAGPRDVKFYLETCTPDSTAKSLAKGGLKKPGGNASGTGGYISVWDYFRKHYPSINMDEKVPVVNAGSRNSPRYLPAEACQVIAGQPLGRKLSPDETRSMINFAVRNPKDNAVSIVRDSKAVLGLSQPSNLTLGAYGISVDPSLIIVPARVLQAPLVRYSKPRDVEARNGTWNMTNVKFNQGATIRKWSFLWIRTETPSRDGYGDIQDLRAHVNEFQRSMKDAGIGIGDVTRDLNPAVVYYRGLLTQAFRMDVCNRLRAFKKSGAEFILVILPFMDVGIYRYIKQRSDRQAGYHTVCMVEAKLKKERGRAQYMANVALKINLKAGGINQKLDEPKLGIISEGKTMVVGIDVTHPSPESKSDAPSIAGIVASVDKFLAQWPAAIGYQDESRKEMVSGLKEMFMSRLRLWKNENNVLPENILIYRDGVSEGQYQLVLDKELPLLRQACVESYPAPDTKAGLPRITIIIVGKRHHTRFYPTRTADADGSSNCRNGTVIDRGVTEVRFWHFFLQAHACLQGTAKPAHYYVILDEIFRRRKPTNHMHRHAADVLEELTYNMCFLFGRATKSVSICPPAYYADLVCERARLFLGDFFEPLATVDTPAPSAAGGAPAADSFDDRDIEIHKDIRNSMFYI